MLTSGMRLGPYELLALVGRGGMGEVWKARDTRLGRTVAVKRLSPEHVERCSNEARAIAALNHPHICQIHDVGPDYLVLEYIDGAPLKGPMPADDVVRVGVQIAGALDAAHRLGILHRDLKPANILLTQGDPSASRAKLLDFGLARLAHADVDVTRTMDGMVMGTAGYMSPEQAEGRPVDARSDIFSLGAVLYEMLSGDRAFAGESALQVMNAVVRNEPAPLHAPPALTSIVLRCLRKRPDERFASMADVRAALERAATTPSASSLGQRPSIAVLPFANLSADPENEYFSDGLAEEILSALARVPGLLVTARTSAFSFRGEKQDVRRIGEALGVATVLEGSVRRAGSRIRVTAQLVDTANGYQRWSERYDREMTDVFAVQDDIAQAIVKTLEVKLTQDAPIAVRKAANIEAYHAFLRGRHYYAKLNPADVARSRECYEEAIALDPSFAPAHAGLALVFASGLIDIPPGDSVKRVRAAARQALAIDDTLGSAHAALALAATAEYDWTEATAQSQIAFASGLSAIGAGSLSGLVMFVLLPLRRLEQAIGILRPAIAEDPLAPLLRAALAQSLLNGGSHAEALQEIDRLIDLQPDFWPAHIMRGSAFTALGDTTEAIAAFEKTLELAPWHSDAMAMLAGNYVRTGDRARGEQLIARLPSGRAGAVGFSPRESRTLALTTFHVLSSELDLAADFAEQLVDSHYTGLPFMMAFPHFRPLRATPRGRRILERMGLQDVWPEGL